MPENHKLSIFTAIKWLTERYIQLEKRTLPYHCKVIGFIDRSGKKLAQVQFAGHSHIIDVDPQKLIDENLFEYFSPSDKKFIFSAVYNKERLKLTDRYYCQEKKVEMVVLTDVTTGNKMTLSAETVSSSMDLIEQINPKDANKIGFMSGVSFIKSIFNRKKDDC